MPKVQYLVRASNIIPGLTSFLQKLARSYLDISRGYSYNFEENGERSLINAVAKIFQHQKICFFDVGANIGDWSIYARREFVEYRGHLFEPDQNTFANLEERLSKDVDLVLNACALSDVTETRSFRSFGQNHGGNTLLITADYHTRDSKLIDVRCCQGAEYCHKHNIEQIDFLKIDTEGWELSVLKGLLTLFSRQAVSIVQFEFGYTHADLHVTMRDFFTFFESYGYILGPLRKHGVEFKTFTYTDNEYRSGPNYVACLPEFKEQLEYFKDL